MKKPPILYCFLVAINVHVYAQRIFDHYSTTSGLSDKICTSIVRDEDGFIWISTKSGLNRFDGKDFTRYYSDGSANQLASNEINKIACLPRHRLAVATNGGLGILDTRTGFVRNILIPAPDELRKTTNEAWDLYLDKKGNIAVTTNGGVFIFDSLFHLIYRFDAFTKADIGKKRLAMVASFIPYEPERVLVYWENNTISLLDLEHKTFQCIKDIPGDEFDLLRSWSGRDYISIGSGNRPGQVILMNLFPGHDSAFIMDLHRHKMTVSALPFSVYREIHWETRVIPLNDSLLAFTTSRDSHDGVLLMKLDNESLQVSFDSQIAEDYFIEDIFQDRDQRLWACGDDGFLKQSFNKAAFNTCTFPDAKTDKKMYHSINGIIYHDRKYFVNQWREGTLLFDEQFKRINNKALENSKYKTLINITPYSSDTLFIVNDIGALLLNTKNYTYKNFRKSGFPAVLDSAAIISSLKDSHNNLWIGLSGGRGVFNLNIGNLEWKYFSTRDRNPVFRLRYPISFAEDQEGNVWMSGKEGITRWNWKKKMFDTVIVRLPWIGEIDGVWTRIASDNKNNLWILKPDFALLKWDLTKNQFTYFPRTSNIEPLRTDDMSGPWDNRLWIKSDKGLLSFDMIHGKFRILTKSDGLFDENIDMQLSYDSLRKRVFVGFDNAFQWFISDSIFNVKKIVTTLITDIRISNDSESLAGKSPLYFSHKQNSFSVSYTGINYNDAEANTYAYRFFENTPDSFIQVGAQKTISFANVRPGRYTFQVKAILSDGTESEVSDVLINIAKPFYQTIWFYIFCSVCILSVTYLIYRYRIRQLLKVQQMRNRIAADLHDDIGSTLSSISIMSELAKDKSPHTMPLLDAIGESAFLIQENMSDLVWAVNPKNDHFENILSRMNQFALRILEAKSVEFHFEYDETVFTDRLSMDQRKKIYMFFKEAINNAAKYSGASLVTATISNKKNFIVLTIQDNGCGFDVNKVNTGNGLANFKRRAEELGGKALIFSERNEGTKIQLSFKTG